MTRIASLVAGAIAVVALSGAAHAASFNCHGRISYTERTICDNPGLSAADNQMASLYFSVYNNAGPGLRPAIQHQQIRWLGWRNRCGANVGCLWTAYNRRIQNLNEAGAY
jgi:uncharacterized protein